MAEVREVNATSCTVTAHKVWSCENYPRCYRGIQAGEDYARCVAFPGHDANGSNRPWMLRLCHHCYCEFGREMPARRTTKKGNPHG